MSARDLVEATALVVAATGVTVGGGIAALWRTSRRMQDIRTALLGEPGRDVAGVRIPPIPSIGERLTVLQQEQGRLADEQGRLADEQRDQGSRLAVVEGECRPDGGGSMYDRITLTSQLVQEIRETTLRHVALPPERAHGGNDA